MKNTGQVDSMTVFIFVAIGIFFGILLAKVSPPFKKQAQKTEQNLFKFEPAPKIELQPIGEAYLEDIPSCWGVDFKYKCKPKYKWIKFVKILDKHDDSIKISYDWREISDGYIFGSYNEIWLKKSQVFFYSDLDPYQDLREKVEKEWKKK